MGELQFFALRHLLATPDHHQRGEPDGQKPKRYHRKNGGSEEYGKKPSDNLTKPLQLTLPAAQLPESSSERHTYKPLHDDSACDPRL